MKIRVDIMLKDGVLDPQGKAISHALCTLGFLGIQDVRIGKTVVLDIDAPDVATATATAKTMAEKLLANLVIEDFRVSII
jgi:phosphoribosylformylglycinamidine synthase subunit PurS